MTTLSLLALAAFTLSFTELPPAKYQVDTKASTLVWTATKVTGSHTGTAPLQGGDLVAEGKVVKHGTFDIDLSSLTVTDIKDPSSNAKLTGHLKSEDFFNTAAHPKASFAISSVTPKSGDDYAIKGKLTIKGITKDIEFPATVKLEGKKTYRYCQD